MELNETGNSSMQEDPRFLAQSYLMYKIGKQYLSIYFIYFHTTNIFKHNGLFFPEFTEFSDKNICHYGKRA